MMPKVCIENIKIWHTTDAIGAIFDIFTILDSFIMISQCPTILLQYFDNTFAIFLVKVKFY